MSKDSVVTTEEGSNFGGRQSGIGLSESDKNYISSLMQGGGAPSKSRVNTSPGARRSPVVTNYYGSQVGNIPIFAASGIVAPVEAIDDMYNKSQMVNLQRLKESAEEFAQLTVGSFNDRYFTIQKGVVDRMFQEYQGVYKDPTQARYAMTQSPGYKRLMSQFNNYASDFNSVAKLIVEQQRNPDMEKYIPPAVQKQMLEFLSTPDMLDKHTKRDKDGNIIGMDFGELTSTMNTMKLYPSLSKVAESITKNYESKIQKTLQLTNISNTRGNDVYESVIATNEEWQKDINDMIDKGMLDGRYSMMDPDSQDYKDTKKMLGDQIRWNIKKDTERQFLSLKDEQMKQQMDEDNVTRTTADMMVYDPDSGNYRLTTVKDVISFNTEYKDNPTTIGIMENKEYTSKNFPGRRIRFTNQSMQYALANQHTEEYTFVFEELRKLPVVVENALKLSGIKLELGKSYTVTTPVCDVVLKTNEGKGSVIDRGSLDKSKLTEEQKQSNEYRGTINRTNSANYPGNLRIQVSDDDGLTWKDQDFTGELNVTVRADEANHAAFGMYNGAFGRIWSKGVNNKEAWTQTKVTVKEAKKDKGVNYSNKQYYTGETRQKANEEENKKVVWVK